MVGEIVLGTEAPVRLAVAAHASPPAGRAARRRWQSEAARLLALGLLPAGAWQIATDPDGRPRLVDGTGRAGPDLSFSHRDGWVAAAVAARGRVGIDLETPRPGRDPLAFARVWLSPPEIALVAAEGEPALLALWTMREALAKAGGGGLAAALAADGAALIAGRDGLCRLGPWRVGHRALGAAHLALAWRPD
ncbi:MAG: hypothetical protein RLZZ501_522 [Pseudomonadota bacterium]